MATEKSKKDILKECIVRVLEEEPGTRDSDFKLVAAVWAKHFYQYIGYQHPLEGGQPYILLKHLSKVPSHDVIKRIRAIIQNKEKRLIPTTIAVAKRRRWNEEDWKKWIRLSNAMPLHP